MINWNLYIYKFLISTVHTTSHAQLWRNPGAPKLWSPWAKLCQAPHSTLAQRLTEKDHKHITMIPNFQGDFEKTFPNLEKSGIPPIIPIQTWNGFFNVLKLLPSAGDGTRGGTPGASDRGAGARDGRSAVCAGNHGEKPWVNQGESSKNVGKIRENHGIYHGIYCVCFTKNWFLTWFKTTFCNKETWKGRWHWSMCREKLDLLIFAHTVPVMFCAWTHIFPSFFRHRLKKPSEIRWFFRMPRICTGEEEVTGASKGWKHGEKLVDIYRKIEK